MPRPKDLDTDPTLLLEAVRQKLGTRTDAELSRRLAVYPSTISKIKFRKASVTTDILLSMHEETGWPIRYLKDLLHSGSPQR